ncbi:MAG: hypothetical protein IT288_16880 [Bdellovibrionales bacterium]|nr:hypothetical protein [Bdellovibrionales bacterium]
MKKYFVALIGSMILSASTAWAADAYCRTVVVHSSNQNLASTDLAFRKYDDTFMPSTLEAHCKSIFASNLVYSLTQSCRAKGGAKARITVQFVTSLGAKTLASYTAFCQDLAPDLYPCTVWDKVLNQWVSTDNPICYGGGDGDGSGGGDGDGSGGP